MSDFMVRLIQVNRDWIRLDQALTQITEMRSEDPSDQLLQLDMDRYLNDISQVRSILEAEFEELAMIAALN